MTQVIVNFSEVDNKLNNLLTLMLLFLSVIHWLTHPTTGVSLPHEK